MSSTMIFVLLAAFFLSIVNGANDISKGIATLIGSNVALPRRAIMVGSIVTGIGALAGVGLLGSTTQTFGSGLLEPGVTPTAVAAIAVILGAGMCVLIATIMGIPVSTTHALVGAMGGVGLVAFGPGSVRFAVVAEKVMLPLLLSPIVAIVLTMALTRFMLWKREDTDHVRADTIVGKMSHAMVDKFARAHWFAACGTCFARGMIDAPKLLAVPVAAGALGGFNAEIQYALFLIIAGGMVLGSVLGGVRVTRVMAEKITRIGSGSGFVAALVTVLLVNASALTGIPLSTTHVSFSAIVGTSLGVHGMQGLNKATVTRTLIAWALTLPVAGLLAVLCFRLFS